MTFQASISLSLEFEILRCSEKHFVAPNNVIRIRCNETFKCFQKHFQHQIITRKCQVTFVLPICCFIKISQHILLKYHELWSHGWDKETLLCFLPMEKLVLSAGNKLGSTWGKIVSLQAQTSPYFFSQGRNFKAKKINVLFPETSNFRVSRYIWKKKII